MSPPTSERANDPAVELASLRLSSTLKPRSAQLDGIAAVYDRKENSRRRLQIVYVGKTDATSRPFDNDREGCCHRQGADHVLLHHEADEHIRFHTERPALGRNRSSRKLDSARNAVRELNRCRAPSGSGAFPQEKIFQHEVAFAATSLLATPSAHLRMTRHRSDSDQATR